MKNYTSILGFEPNDDQKKALAQLSQFVESDNDVFILKGSAGTGKTSIVKAITTYLTTNDINFKIGAPTGRAAMIIGNKTVQKSRTIHSHLYIPEKLKDGRGVKLIRKINGEKSHTIYLIDEASMVSNTHNKSENFFVKKPLLTDLIDFVKQGNPENKIVFIGDRFQLPPVKEDFSPALSSKYLREHMSLKSEGYELTKVMRQSENSSVLDIATQLRTHMQSGVMNANVSLPREARSSRALNKYLKHFSFENLDNVVAICPSNRDVDIWNAWIREKLGLADNLLSKNDFVVSQNTWMNNTGCWIFRGEFGRVKALETKIEKFANLHFVDAIIEFPASDGKMKEIKTKVLLESLYTRYGQLEPEQEKLLYAQTMKYNPRFRTSQKNADDKYLGAIRLRHAYATTCHKAQGGEWDNVLIHPWLVGKDLQWTYTAVTRARHQVFSYAA